MPQETFSLKQLAQGSRPIRIGFLLVPDFPLMTFSAALDSLRQGNRLAKRKVFEWILISADGGHVKSSSGLGFDMDAAMTKAPRCDVVIVCAGINYADSYDPNIFAWLRRVYSEGCILGGSQHCGLFFLQRPACWRVVGAQFIGSRLQAFAASFRTALATDDIFAIDGRFLTSSGGTVTLDMMLYLIAAAEGRDLASQISTSSIILASAGRMTFKRWTPKAGLAFAMPSSASSFAAWRRASTIQSKSQRLADSVALSVRQLERLFHANLGKSPSKFYIELRMSRARELLANTELAIANIAEICGYESTSHFSRIYRQHFNESPAATRKAEPRLGMLALGF